MAKAHEAYYNQAVVDSILNDILLGLNLDDSAVRHLIPPRIVRSWFNSDFKDFRQKVQKAEVECKRLHLGRIVSKDATVLGVKGSMFILERKFRDEYGVNPTDTLSLREIEAFMVKLSGILGKHLESVSPDILRSIAEDISQIQIGRLGKVSERTRLGTEVEVEAEPVLIGEVETEP